MIVGAALSVFALSELASVAFGTNDQKTTVVVADFLVYGILIYTAWFVCIYTSVQRGLAKTLTDMCSPGGFRVYLSLMTILIGYNYLTIHHYGAGDFSVKTDLATGVFLILMSIIVLIGVVVENSRKG